MYVCICKIIICKIKLLMWVQVGAVGVLCVFIYLCMYVCMYVCVCVCVFIYVCVCVCVWPSSHSQTQRELPGECCDVSLPHPLCMMCT